MSVGRGSLALLSNAPRAFILGLALVASCWLQSAGTTTTATAVQFLAATTKTTTTTSTTWATDKGHRLVATNFVKYFNSDTALVVSGSVNFEQTISDSGLPGQVVTWDLEGIDKACKTGSGNQCGIHIHEGTSCTEDALGHFWNETLVSGDPWTAVQYHGADGASQLAEGVKVITGFEREEILGRAVVVHDSVAPGRRIACALITEEQGPSTTTTTNAAPSWHRDFTVLVVVASVLLLAACGTAGGLACFFCLMSRKAEQ